jgi:hypothetical protein
MALAADRPLASACETPRARDPPSDRSEGEAEVKVIRRSNEHEAG